jgi:hypothetical protein
MARARCCRRWRCELTPGVAKARVTRALSTNPSCAAARVYAAAGCGAARASCASHTHAPTRQVGVYNHVPGDGRELVVTDPDAVKIRAEDGRSVEGVDISPFISNLPFGKVRQLRFITASSPLARPHSLSAMKKLRIAAQGFGTGRQKRVLERWTNPKLSRRACTCEYGLQSGGGELGGPRVCDLPPEIPNASIRNCFHRCTPTQPPHRSLEPTHSALRHD